MEKSLIWALAASTIVLFLSLCTSIYFNYKFGLILINLEDGIEESLDILDEKYSSISKILERPVFFDSVEVRQVIRDIKGARESVLHVANILGSIDEDAVLDLEENKA
jgi:hypothetical protein